MQPQMIPYLIPAFSFITFFSLIIGLALFVRTRALALQWNALETRFDAEISDLSGDLDTLSRISGEQARRIAWLENRVATAPEETETLEQMLSATAKPTITERRHRVLSLARRGQDTQTIARTLGMPHGEVELMINLSKAA